MTSLTHDGITSVLGRVGTNASLEELAEAKAWINNDEAMINEGHHLASGRVGTLVRILMRAEEEDAPAVTATDGYA